MAVSEVGWRRGGATRRVGVPALAALVLAGACSRGINYDDLGGPRHYGERVLVPGDSAGCASDTLRVVTLNLKWARHLAGAVELFRSVATLRDADVIALQEMDGRGTRYIAAALEMSYVYYPATLHPRTGADFGNAILSRWPIVGDRKILLPHLGRMRATRRAAVAATIDWCHEPLTVYSVHFGTPLEIGYASRREQAAAVLADARQHGRVIVAGDLNSKGVGKVFIAQGYAWPTREQPATNFIFSYDHIFLRGVALVGPTSTGVVGDNRGVSDHKPVWAAVGLAPREAARTRVDGARR